MPRLLSVPSFVWTSTLLGALSLAACQSENAPHAAGPSDVPGAGAGAEAPRAFVLANPNVVACDASNAFFETSTPPSNWTVTGRATFVIKGNAVVGEQAKSARGDMVANDTTRIPLTHGAVGDALAAWICKVGAVGKPNEKDTTSESDIQRNGGGSVTVDVLAPSAEDEAADLTRICTTVADQGTPVESSFLEIQPKLRWLTSKRYRGMVHSVEEDIDRTKTRAELRAVAASDATSVEAIVRARGVTSCTYVEALRNLSTSRP